MSTHLSIPRRLEDLRFLTGRGRYVDDIQLPGMLHLAFVRSPHAHARILRVHRDAAARMPGVVAVLTANELGRANKPLMPMVAATALSCARTQCPLAKDRVRYVGETIAAVLADARYTAADGAAGVAVDYEPLSAVVDARRAVERDAPRLHDDCSDNVVGTWEATVGRPNEAFAQAAVTIELDLEMPRSTAQPIEPRGTVAQYHPADDVLTVWTSTQVPHAVRLGLALALDRAEESIRIVAPDVGGGFGCKLCLGPEDVLCAHIALTIGRPVKWIESRYEHLQLTGHSRGQAHRIALALATDGTLLGLRDRVLHDNGAYTPYGLRLPSVTLASLPGPYRIPALDLQAAAVFTNKPPAIPYRGAGQPEAVFALERAMDRAAHLLGVEPAELRRRNLLRRDEFPYRTGIAHAGTGEVVYDAGSCAPCLKRVLARLDLPTFRAAQTAQRAAGRCLGTGVACYMEATGAGSFESAVVRIDGGGFVTVFSGICSQGQGHETLLATLCATALGVPVEKVRVRLGDTAAIPFGVGTWGSRAAVAAGSAVTEAARRVKDRVVHAAARVLEAHPDDIRFEKGWAYVAGAQERGIGMAELARMSASGRRPLLFPDGPGLEAACHFAPAGVTYASGAHAAVVELDLETGAVRIIRYLVVHDCGRVLQPAAVEGQIAGGTIQGIGGALWERLSYDERGQPLATSFMEYSLPKALSAPRVELEHCEWPSALNPLGARGAGEGGTIPAYAVIASAIEDALRPFEITIDTVPVTPAMIRRLVAASGPTSISQEPL
jgi:aerobic carbon-monoxide dehydrogenase large subunit